ncbi:MAG: hypothetical protein FJX59_17435, partial [Alphaproteobacteria bacterium]|nr:hypothetical protein [Alphaproteobacteria bacterium]
MSRQTMPVQPMPAAAARRPPANGLLSGPPAAPQPAAALTPAQSQAVPAQPSDGGDTVTPEEQAQYDRFVGLAFDLVHNPKNQNVTGAIEQMLKVPNTKEGLATAAVTVAMKVYDAAKAEGTRLMPAVLQHGLVEIVEDLGELARGRGIKQLDEDELSGAYIGALDLARVEVGRRGDIDAADPRPNGPN